MNFVETGQACIIVERLSSQNRTGDFSDVDFVVKEQIINAHRNVLAARSEYFATLFKRNEVIKEVIMVENCQSVDAFRNFLNYMYTGTIYVDGTNVAALMRMVSQFSVDKLMGYCETYLQLHLVPANSYVVCDLANKHNLTQLQKHVSDFIEKNSLQILEQDDNLLQLNIDRMKKFLTKITVTELEKFVFFCKWIGYDLKKRKGGLKQLLATINWKEMDMEAFKQKVKNTYFLHNITKCYEVLVSFLKSKNIEFSIPESEIMALKEAAKTLSPVKIAPRSNELGDSTMAAIPIEVNLPKLRAKRLAALKSYRKRPKDNQNIKTKGKRKYKGTDAKIRKAMSPENAIVDSNVAVEHDHTFHSHAPKKKANSDPNRPFFWKGRRMKLKCEQCTFATNNDRILDKHMNRVHGEIDSCFQCNLCEFSCNFSIEFYTHLKTHYDGPPYQCDNCDFSCKLISRFYDHILIHTNLYPCQCKHCDEKFRSPDILRKHVYAKHSDEKVFVCQTCGKGFTRKAVLQSHQIVHEVKKLHLCEICGFSNKDIRYLRVHMRKHTNKRFDCDHPGCNYSTIYQSLIKIHKRGHTGERPYVCSYCGKKFSLHHSMKEHEMIHESKTYQCRLCCYSTPRTDRLQRHVEKYHSNDGYSDKIFKPRKKQVARLYNEEQTDHYQYGGECIVPDRPQEKDMAGTGESSRADSHMGWLSQSLYLCR